ncbi:hypothetical protein NDU88_001734, partial [Pleurodeles waltl]
LADTACTNKGGKCVDYRNYKCIAGVQTAICNGDTYRRCCLPCDATCVANDKSWSANDGACTGKGGVCQVNSNYCGSSYSSGLCGGPTNRQCCMKSAADSACTSKGGQCVDYRNYKCIAGVETGICSGDTYRRCCLPCDATCIANDKSWSTNDGGCTSKGGVCQLNSNYCDGSYSSGLCGGPTQRQCCSKSSGKWATTCAGQSSNRVRGCDSHGCGHYNAPRGSRLHKGVDVICNDGSVVYAPFTGTKQGQAKPYGDGSVIDNGIKISG